MLLLPDLNIEDIINNMKCRKINEQEEQLILFNYTLWRFHEFKKHPTLTLADIGDVIRRFENREKVMIDKLNSKAFKQTIQTII